MIDLIGNKRDLKQTANSVSVWTHYFHPQPLLRSGLCHGDPVQKGNKPQNHHQQVISWSQKNNPNRNKNCWNESNQLVKKATLAEVSKKSFTFRVLSLIPQSRALKLSAAKLYQDWCSIRSRFWKDYFPRLIRKRYLVRCALTPWFENPRSALFKSFNVTF